MADNDIALEYRRLARVVHELKVPLVAIRGAVEFVGEELRTKGVKLREDYIGDISGYCELMGRLLVDTRLLLRSKDGLDLVLMPGRYLLLRDIVMPTINQIMPLLSERGFSPRSIHVNGFDCIPALFVDRTLMQQVFFNLLSNAIKYAYEDPIAFSVEIVARPDHIQA